MAKVRCEQGHFYDDSRFYSCPHCSVDVDLDLIRKQTKNNLNERVGDYVETVLTYTEPAAVQEKDSETNNPASSEEKTSGETIGLYKFDSCEPVVAWVICMNEDMRGQDFRLTEGRNVFGNKPNSNICLPSMKDGSGNMAIIYDSQDNLFYIQSGQSEVCVNGDLIEKSAQLIGQSVIDIDEYNLVFIPFCETGRNWNN